VDHDTFEMKEDLLRMTEAIRFDAIIDIVDKRIKIPVVLLKVSAIDKTVGLRTYNGIGADDVPRHTTNIIISLRNQNMHAMIFGALITGVRIMDSKRTDLIVEFVKVDIESI
jgi:hypothetical protein